MWLIWFLAFWLVVGSVAGVFFGKCICWACGNDQKPPKRRAF